MLDSFPKNNDKEKIRELDKEIEKYQEILKNYKGYLMSRGHDLNIIKGDKEIQDKVQNIENNFDNKISLLTDKEKKESQLSKIKSDVLEYAGTICFNNLFGDKIEAYKSHDIDDYTQGVDILAGIKDKEGHLFGLSIDYTRTESFGGNIQDVIIKQAIIKKNIERGHLRDVKFGPGGYDLENIPGFIMSYNSSMFDDLRSMANKISEDKEIKKDQNYYDVVLYMVEQIKYQASAYEFLVEEKIEDCEGDDCDKYNNLTIYTSIRKSFADIYTRLVQEMNDSNYDQKTITKTIDRSRDRNRNIRLSTAVFMGGYIDSWMENGAGSIEDLKDLSDSSNLILEKFDSLIKHRENRISTLEDKIEENKKSSRVEKWQAEIKEHKEWIGIIEKKQGNINKLVKKYHK